MVSKVASNCKFELLAIDTHIHVPFNTNVLADDKDKWLICDYASD